MVSGLGLLLSFALFFMMRGWEQRSVDRAAEDLVREQVERLRITILRSMEVLHSIAALHQAHGTFGRVEFREFVTQSLARQPELQALSWNPVVPASRRAIIEAGATAEGISGFSFREQSKPGHFIAEGARSDYVPVYFIEPLEKNSAALGFDLGSDPTRREAMERALSSGQAVATTPLRLAQGPGDSAGLLVLLPVYRGGPPASEAARRERVEGFAVAVFRIADLVNDSFQHLEARGIDVALFDQSSAGPPIFSPRASRLSRARSVVPLEVAGRGWNVGFAPNANFSTGSASHHSWLALTGGVFFTLLTTAYLWNGWRQSRVIATANAALQEEIAVRKRAEAAAASANQAKSDFLANMSHEIRTPLNAILGYAQLMQRDRELSADHRDAVRGISSSGEHLLGLINEVLDLAKIEAGRMELNPVDFDLDDVGRSLASTFKQLCAQKRIGFRLESGFDGPAWVRGDESKLRQVLINLLGNAVKFTVAGEVALRISSPSPHRFRFEVFDTGLGIPDDERDDIFKPFHQGSGARHQGGTGLGLSIARRQVELLGGALELQSERGAGSRFYFSIPLDWVPIPPTASEVVASVERLAPGCHARVLVVDDSRENARVLEEMLSTIGCDVECAGDAQSALQRARESEPDIVFLDLLLNGRSALDIVGRLQTGTRSEGVKVVMHTAAPLGSHREAALAAGCVDFLAKPLRAEKVYECLRTHLGVRFQYSVPEPVSRTTAPRPTRIALPDALCARLHVAAELHSTTALKSAVRELRGLGPDAQWLAEQIRELMRSYDMDGIQRLLITAVDAPAMDATLSQSHGAHSPS